MIVSGGTGSGKTTLLNALSSYIPSDERLITIEDAAELQLQQPHVGRLETRPCQRGRQGGSPPARAGQECASHAARPHYHWRMSWRRSVRHAAGDEYRPRRLDDDHPCQHSPRDAMKRLEQMVAWRAVSMTVASIRSQIASAIRMLDPAAAASRWKAPGHRASARSPAWKAMSPDAGNLIASVKDCVDEMATCMGLSGRPASVPHFLQPILRRTGIELPASHFDPNRAL